MDDYTLNETSFAPLSSGDNDHLVTSQVVDYYHESLKDNTKALDYLQRRCINDSNVIEHFRLGFCDRTLGLRLPEKNRKEGALLRGQLQRIGLVKASGHELFRGSITVPIIENGVVKQIYGRKITAGLRTGTELHTFLNNRYTGVFNLKAIKTCDELILCQSVLDALTFWSAGFKNVTCCHGADAIGDELLHALQHSDVKKLLIAFANTEAGNTATKKLADQVMTMGIEPYHIDYPFGMDANAYAVSQSSPNHALGDLIRKATWLGKPKTLENEQSVIVPDEKVFVLPDTNSEPTPVTEDFETLPASITPPVTTPIEAEVKDKEIIINLGDRRYRVRGLTRNLSYDYLKVNLLVNRGEALHVDTFDMYASRPRSNFIAQAAGELNVPEETIKTDLSRVLLKLELLQDDNITHSLTSKKIELPSLSKKEQTEAMALLKSPDLLNRILTDYEQCGVVGERNNKLIGYLSALSRKLDKPLAVIIQSTSAAGKSTLMDSILSFVPEEDKVQYSAVTGQSLFYMGDINLQHKILAVSEEEGASKAAYALKLLNSEGHLSIASTGKDTETGRHVTHEYSVTGPIMLFSTTTSIEIDEELLNRCLVLTVDEERQQTRAIHDWQRFEETLDGLLASQKRDDIIKLHQNAQRLIKPLKVINPYATQLTFQDDKTRTRRDHKKYLTLIRSIALLHQHQREIKTTLYRGKAMRYIEVTHEDIESANQLIHEVLGRSLDDVPPQTRRLLGLIDNMVSEHCNSMQIKRSDYQFTRKDVRNYCGWGDTQLKVHLKRLEALEYLLRCRDGRGRQIVYELLYNSEGQSGNPFMMGLTDVSKLEDVHQPHPSGSSRPEVGAKSEGCHSPISSVTVSKNKMLPAWDENTDLAAIDPALIPAHHTSNHATWSQEA